MLASAVVAQCLHCVSSWRRVVELHRPREMPLSPKLFVLLHQELHSQGVLLLWCGQWTPEFQALLDGSTAPTSLCTRSEGLLGNLQQAGFAKATGVASLLHPPQGQVRAQCSPQHSLTSKSSLKFCTRLRCTPPSKQGGHRPGPGRKNWVSKKWKWCHYFNTD